MLRKNKLAAKSGGHPSESKHSAGHYCEEEVEYDICEEEGIEETKKKFQEHGVRKELEGYDSINTRAEHDALDDDVSTFYKGNPSEKLRCRSKA